MTVRVNKPSFNLREKLSELTQSIGLKGRELMRAVTAQDARDFVSAGRKNIIINGDFRIAQRGTSSNSMAGSIYATVDRFFSYTANTNGTVTQTQDNDTPFGIGYSFKFESSSTGSPTNTSYYGIQQRIEGNHCADAIVYGSTVSFWVKSNRSGFFPVAVFQSDSSNVTTRYSTQAYVDGNGTWQYITKYIPPGPAANNPRNSNAASYYLDISMQAGSTYAFTSGQLNNWVQSGSVAGPNFGLCESNGNYIQFAMIQVEVGKNATEFEYRPIGEELALCQRYFQTTNTLLTEASPNFGETAYTGWQYQSDAGSLRIRLPVEMRTTPTAAIIGTPSGSPGASGTIGAYGNLGWMPLSSISIGDVTPLSVRVNCSGLTGSGKDAFGLYFYGTYQNSTITLNAEL